MFPSGKTGTASANASPSRGFVSVRTNASNPSSGASSPGKNGSSAAVQPVKSPAAAGAANRTGTRTETAGGLARRRSRSAKLSRKSPASIRAGGLAAGSSASIRSTRAQSGRGRSGRT